VAVDQALEDGAGLVRVDGHGGLVVQRVALYAEEYSREVEFDVDGAYSVPAVEAAVGSDDGGEEVGSIALLDSSMVRELHGCRPFLSFGRHDASREECREKKVAVVFCV
jgi:hypothetical protein